MEKMIEFAEQQFLGYLHAKRGYGLIDLVVSMGLSKNEWTTIKENYSLDFTSDEKEEIEEYFSQEAFN